MPRLSRLGKVLVGSGFAGAFFWCAPAAGAQDIQDPVTETPVQEAESGVNSAAFVEDVRAGLAQWGIDTPAVDPAITDAVDEAIGSVVPQENDTPDLPIETPAPETSHDANANATAGTGNPVADAFRQDPVAGAEWFIDNAKRDPRGAAEFVAREATQPEFRPLNVDPYYHWRNDGFSKAMAGKPDADFVLNRVPGSYFDAPEAPVESGIVQAQGKSLYGPGTPVFVGDEMICTMAVTGTDAQGHKVGLTAGHCGEVGDHVVSMDSPQVGPSGTVAVRNDALDFAVVELGSNAEVTRSYNGLTIDGFGAPSQPGETITKQGVASNQTTGKTLANTDTMQVAQLCAMPGDSGAPVVKDGKLVGMVNGGVIRNFACVTPLQGMVHSPTYIVDAEDVAAKLNEQGGVGAGFTLPEAKERARRN